VIQGGGGTSFPQTLLFQAPGGLLWKWGLVNILLTRYDTNATQQERRVPMTMRIVLMALLMGNMSFYCRAETILASVFNKEFSCTNPFLATETTTIILDEDIAITGVCELIAAGEGFNKATDRIIFTSTTGHRVVLRQSSTWKIALTIQFKGNARLEKEPRSTIFLENAALIMSETTIYRTIPFSSMVS
jgi:hypothetical protein